MFSGRLNILMQFFTKQRIKKQLQNWKILPLKFVIELSLTDRKLGLVEKKNKKPDITLFIDISLNGL